MKKRKYLELPLADCVQLQKDVISWVDKFWLDSGSTKLPTFRQVSDKFGIYLSDIETLVEDCELGYNVGFQSGSGYWVDKMADYTVEPSDYTSQKFWNLYYGLVSPCTTDQRQCHG